MVSGKGTDFVWGRSTVSLIDSSRIQPENCSLGMMIAHCHCVLSLKKASRCELRN